MLWAAGFTLGIAALVITVDVSLAQDSKGDDGKIVNGTLANAGEFPFMVSLRRSGHHSCGATLLNAVWVLTAAHCVRGAIPQKLSVQYGSNILDRNSTKVAPVRAIHIHPGYDPQDKYVNDIALLELETPLTLNKTIQPVRLPPQCGTDNSSAVLIGWGLNATGGVVQKHLQKVNLDVFSAEECDRRHQTQLHGGQLCAGVPEGGKGQCSGDSGGPLLQGGQQIGIVSWSIKPCARPPYPGVFTRVSTYVDWMLSTLSAAATGTATENAVSTQLWIGEMTVRRAAPSLVS